MKARLFEMKWLHHSFFLDLYIIDGQSLCDNWKCLILKLNDSLANFLVFKKKIAKESPLGNFLGLSKTCMGLTFVDALGPRDPVKTIPKSNPALEVNRRRQLKCVCPSNRPYGFP